MKEKEKALHLINNVIVANIDTPNFKTIMFASLVQEGKMTPSLLSGILSLNVNLERLGTDQLYWLYVALSEIDNLPKVSAFFTEQEQQDANNASYRTVKDSFPLTFNILGQLSAKEEYIFLMSYQEINALAGNVIKIVPGIQRETVTTEFQGNLVTHVKYDDERAREIGKEIANGDFWANMLRFSLILNGDEDYEVRDGKLIINSGLIAIIDGQHRIMGIDYALAENPSADGYMIIVFTITTIKKAQEIINQEEKRAPLNKFHVGTMANNNANNIARDLKNDEDLNDIYKFIKTMDQYQSGAGFVVEYILADAIESYYSVNKQSMSLKNRRDYVRWFKDFLIELDDIMHDAFFNYKNEKSWKTNPYAFYGYLYLSSILRETKGWETQLKTILSHIDFDEQPWRSDSMAKKHVEMVFKEAKEVCA